MARTCIFCGSAGPLTKDHVITKRTSKQLREDYGVLTFRTVHMNPDGTTSQFSTKDAEIAPKFVCEQNCNSGWLRKLEERTWGIISPIMRGLERTLSLRRQRILAAFVTAKVMVLEFENSSRHTPHFTSEERRAFHRSLTPPGGVHIWIAGTNDQQIGRTRLLDITFEHEQEGERVKGLLAFIVQDRLVMALFAHRVRGRAVWHFPIGYRVNTIWPIEAKIRWPPPLPLNAKQMDEWMNAMEDIEPEILPPRR